MYIIFSVIMLICSWAGFWYLSILVIFSLLLASENLRAGSWISPTLLYNIPVSFLGCRGVLFTITTPPPTPPLHLPPYSVPWDLFSYWFPAYSLWQIPCTLGRPHEPWRDLSQFFCSEVSTGCCLMVQESPGSLRTVFSHSSCYAPNIQWAVSYPLGKAPCVFEGESISLSSCLLPRSQLTTSLLSRKTSFTMEGSHLAFLPCPQLSAGFCLALNEGYFSL